MKIVGCCECTVGYLRAHLCYFLLVFFLGLFVSAMTVPTLDIGMSVPEMTQVFFSFPHPITYQYTINERRQTVTLLFPGMSSVELLEKYMAPVAKDDGTLLSRVEVAPSAECEGARVTFHIASAQDDIVRVRVLQFAQPHQLMVVMYRNPFTEYEQAQKVLSYTSASIYKA